MLVIVDYGVGNLASVANMFAKAGVKNVLISKKKEEIEKAEKLLLPGVGAFDAGMGELNRSGLVDVLNKKVLLEKTPVLGICLGMQLLTKGSEEGKLPGLGWIDAYTYKFDFTQEQSLSGLKVPHMGWNFVYPQNNNPLITSSEQQRFYFVHSYYVKPEKKETTIATSKYGHEFTCMVKQDNIYGAQFHPEKSHRFGMNLLLNFATLTTNH